MRIEMRKLKSLPGFNAAGCCISPRYWGKAYALYVSALEQAKILAKNCDDICVAVVQDPHLCQEYVLAEAAPMTWEPKFILFNAEKVNEEEGEVRVTVNSKVSGKPVYEAWVKYTPGGLA